MGRGPVLHHKFIRFSELQQEYQQECGGKRGFKSNLGKFFKDYRIPERFALNVNNLVTPLEPNAASLSMMRFSEDFASLKTVYRSWLQGGNRCNERDNDDDRPNPPPLPARKIPTYAVKPATEGPLNMAIDAAQFMIPDMANRISASANRLGDGLMSMSKAIKGNPVPIVATAAFAATAVLLVFQPELVPIVLLAL